MRQIFRQFRRCAGSCGAGAGAGDHLLIKQLAIDERGMACATATVAVAVVSRSAWLLGVRCSAVCCQVEKRRCTGKYLVHQSERYKHAQELGDWGSQLIADIHQSLAIFRRRGSRRGGLWELLGSEFTKWQVVRACGKLLLLRRTRSNR